MLLCAQLDPLFADLRTWLPGLVQQVQARQQGERVLQPQGPFAVDAQRQLCVRVMHWLQFDFDGGRLDLRLRRGRRREGGLRTARQPPDHTQR